MKFNLGSPRIKRKEIKYEKLSPVKKWALTICLLTAGLLFLFIYSGVIKMSESSTQYGNLPILFISIMFLFVGMYLSACNLGFKLKKNSLSAKVCLFIFLTLLLVPFHIVLYKEYIEYSLYNLIAKNWLSFIVIPLFDIVALVLLGSIFYDIKKLRQK